MKQFTDRQLAEARILYEDHSIPTKHACLELGLADTATSTVHKLAARLGWRKREIKAKGPRAEADIDTRLAEAKRVVADLELQKAMKEVDIHRVPGMPGTVEVVGLTDEPFTTTLANIRRFRDGNGFGRLRDLVGSVERN